MHYSTLSQIIIDCASDTWTDAAAFWPAALGLAADADEPPDSRYLELKGTRAGLGISLQRVDEPSAVHLDIESSDVEAEVARLEALGAKRIRKVKTWWVMEAPTGHRFCVIRQQGPDLETPATRWDT